MVDEAIFTVRTFLTKSWSHCRQSVQQVKPIQNQPCIAVVAAISSRRGLIHYVTREHSIKSDVFSTFLQVLNTMSDSNLNILMDNSSVHRSQLVKTKIEELQINVLWNVPYSPQYNGIELFWALAKRNFRTQMLQVLTGQLEMNNMEEIVVKSMHSVDNEQTKRCCLNSIK